MTIKKLSKSALLAAIEREPGARITVGRIKALVAAAPAAALSARKPAPKPAARRPAPPSASRVTLSADRPDPAHPRMVGLRKSLEGLHRFNATQIDSMIAGQWARMVKRGELV